MTDVPKKKPSGGRRHKAKGDAYERELADFLNRSLFPLSHPPQIHRTPMSGSFSVIKGVGTADLTGTPGLWVEAKRTETCSPHKFLAQAKRGATAYGSVDKPVVITRRNLQSLDESLVMLSLKDFLPFYEAWLRQNTYLPPLQEAPPVADPAQLPLTLSF